MIAPLPAEELRWVCDPARFSFETTSDVPPAAGVVGQSSALEALRFGLECDAVGQNVFVRGLRGTGRMTMVQRLLDELRPVCARKNDRCYVHNFEHPDRPRLITLPPGTAKQFRRDMREFAEFVSSGLPTALDEDSLREARQALQEQVQARADAISNPIEAELAEAGMALVSLQASGSTQTAIFPLHEGKPIPPEQLEQLIAEGKAEEKTLEQFSERVGDFRNRLEKISSQISEILREGSQQSRELVENTARKLLRDSARPIRERHGQPVDRYLDEVVDDVIEHLGAEAEPEEWLRRYGVNVLTDNEGDDQCPIVVENTPTLVSLLGTVEPDFRAPQGAISDYTRIRAGSLLRADGGYLILDAVDLLSEPGSWKVLMRTLRTEQLEIVPPELGWPMRAPSTKPEPIPIKVRVILLGDGGVFHALDQSDQDFQNLFKVLADFDTTITRNDEGLQQYAGVLSRIANEESLIPFDPTAVAALAEHGARIAARREKLTARFGRVADLAREASYLAKREGSSVTTRKEVEEAVVRTKQRGNLPSRRFQEFLKDGTIVVETEGKTIGQINGLAVISAGPLTYGFPARITATIGAGSAGVIDIESRAAMSGSIHTKGFHILGGQLRHLLQTDHPLAFSASITFEQSYGGIDGDSASGAEMCCLLSALTGCPIRQDLAITGAIDQHGRIQSIGGVNEKIEGFYDTCAARGLTGSQGVIIPKSNATDLQLRQDVVEACRSGKFAVYAVERVHEALELLTGVPAGERDEEGNYPEGTLLAQALERAHEFWRKTTQGPNLPKPDSRRDGDDAPPKPAPPSER